MNFFLHANWEEILLHGSLGHPTRQGVRPHCLLAGNYAINIRKLPQRQPIHFGQHKIAAYYHIVIFQVHWKRAVIALENVVLEAWIETVSCLCKSCNRLNLEEFQAQNVHLMPINTFQHDLQ